MIIRAATLAILMGESKPEIKKPAGRLVRPMGEIQPVKTYKPRKYPEPTNADDKKLLSKAEAKRKKMREYYRKHREQILAQQKAHKANKNTEH